MIVRRYLSYLVFGAGVVVVTAMLFAGYALRKTTDHAARYHLAFVQSVSRFVDAILTREALRLDQFLHDLPPGPGNEQAACLLQQFRRGSLDRGGVALLDGQREVFAADLDGGGLPPPEALLSAVRRAEADGKAAMTDLWLGPDGRPRVALVLGQTRDQGRTTAVMTIRLDGDDFQRLFEHFHGAATGHMRLQVLDSKGVAIYATRAEERYRAFTQDAYNSEMVPLGRTLGEGDISLVAPVTGTGWSVVLHESPDEMFTPMRELIFGSAALVCVILAVFGGFFMTLSRRVVRPLRDVVKLAARIAQGDEPDPARSQLEPRDEFDVLAKSIETLRLRTAGQAHADRTRAAPATADAEEAIRRDFEAILADLSDIHPFCGSILLLGSTPSTPGHLLAHGVEVQPIGKVEEAVAKLDSGQTVFVPRSLEEAGIIATVPSAIRAFVLERIPVLGATWGYLWIGLRVGPDEIGPNLAPALKLVAAHIQHLAVRGVLHEQLRKEHDGKTRLLGHLFKAEDEERRRLAREIHDETAQVLNVLLMDLETFPGPQEAAEQARRLERAKSLVSRLLDETDRLIRHLRPTILDDLGLVEAVRETCQDRLAGTGIDFDLQVAWAETVSCPKEVEVAVYRVFQEAIRNAARHSGARRVSLRLDAGDHHLQGIVEDDGRGMDLACVHDVSARRGWGLMGIKERIAQLDGEIRFSTPQRGGLRVEFHVPLGLQRGQSQEA